MSSNFKMDQIFELVSICGWKKMVLFVKFGSLEPIKLLSKKAQKCWFSILLQFERVIYMGSGDPILTNNTIFFIRRSRRVRIFDPFRNLMTSKILDFPGYKGLTCNYRGLSYYDVIKKFPHAGLMRTFQISKKGVIYFRKNAKSRSTNFFPSWKLYSPHYQSRWNAHFRIFEFLGFQPKKSHFRPKMTKNRTQWLYLGRKPNKSKIQRYTSQLLPKTLLRPKNHKKIQMLKIVIQKTRFWKRPIFPDLGPILGKKKSENPVNPPPPTYPPLII